VFGIDLPSPGLEEIEPSNQRSHGRHNTRASRQRARGYKSLSSRGLSGRYAENALKSRGATRSPDRVRPPAAEKVGKGALAPSRSHVVTEQPLFETPAILDAPRSRVAKGDPEEGA
jgi:hypothetical protein